MNFRNFLFAVRLLRKDLGYTSVVIFSLSISIAVCFLLLGQVHQVLGFDKHVPEVERVYQLKQRMNWPGAFSGWSAMISPAARRALVKNGLQFQTSQYMPRSASFRVGAEVQSIQISLVDPEFPQILQLKPLQGDLSAALNKPDALALTQETAIQLFGTENVVGKIAHIEGLPYTIAAILQDPPGATQLHYAALTGIKTNIFPGNLAEQSSANWGQLRGFFLLKLSPGQTIKPYLDTLSREAGIWAATLPPEMVRSLAGKPLFEFRLSPLHGAFVDGEFTKYYGLSAVALLILLLGAINYVNLTTVRTLRRQREIAVRKVLGASISQVSQQFMAESMLVSFLATALGLLLAWLMLPTFEQLVNLRLDEVFSPFMLLATLVAGLGLGFVVGLYPVWVARQVPVNLSLSGRGNSESASGLWLRRMLTVVQFAVAMGLVGVTLGIAWQTKFSLERNPGFDPGELMVVSVPKVDARLAAFRGEVLRLPGVLGIASSYEAVVYNSNSSQYRRTGGEPTSLNNVAVSPEYLELLGVKAVAGRIFEPSRDKAGGDLKMVINIAATKALGFATPQEAVGQRIETMGPAGSSQIIGVVPDIRHRSIRYESQPTIYWLGDYLPSQTLRFQGSQDVLQKQFAEVWQRHYPDDVFSLDSMPALLELQYADDRLLAKLLLSSALIATTLAAFGIYALSAYNVRRRAREIVLRKLYGADRMAIARFVSGEYLLLIAVGALIGLPLAALGIELYLANFVERAPMAYWSLLLSLLVAVSVALLSTWRYTLLAMRMAPALALQD